MPKVLATAWFVAGALLGQNADAAAEAQNQLVGLVGLLLLLAGYALAQGAATAEMHVSVRDSKGAVVTNGTATQVGFPPAWNVAAKTGTAEVGDGAATNAWVIGYAGLPGATLKRIDDSAHFIMFDQPEVFYGALDAFLAR